MTRSTIFAFNVINISFFPLQVCYLVRRKALVEHVGVFCLSILLMFAFSERVSKTMTFETASNPLVVSLSELAAAAKNSTD